MWRRHRAWWQIGHSGTRWDDWAAGGRAGGGLEIETCVFQLNSERKALARPFCLCSAADRPVERACRDEGRREKKKKKKEGGEWRTGPRRVPLKIGSKLSIPVLLLSAKLCLCSPFQGTPGVLASICCAQNALRCHLFKHSEPLASRDRPLFIRPLILAARMTT